MFEAADRARLARERSWQDREMAAEREAAARRVVEDEAARLGTGMSQEIYQHPPVIFASIYMYTVFLVVHARSIHFF